MGISLLLPSINLLSPNSIRPYMDYGKPIEIKIAYKGLLS